MSGAFSKLKRLAAVYRLLGGRGNVVIDIRLPSGKPAQLKFNTHDAARKFVSMAKRFYDVTFVGSHERSSNERKS